LALKSQGRRQSEDRESDHQLGIARSAAVN
jgi:hypothetical protein